MYKILFHQIVTSTKMENQHIEFIQSKTKNSYLLVYQNFIFQKAKVNKDESVNWRCENYYKKGEQKCSVTCTTSNSEFIRQPTKHNHEPASRARIQLHQVLYDIKQVAPEQKRDMKRIFEEATQGSISKHNEHGITLEEFAKEDFTFKNFKTMLYKIRHVQMN